MPSNDPYQNAPHLQPRHGVPAGSHPPVIGQHEQCAATELEGYVEDRDAGAVRRFVHELEHGLSVWKVSPWRMLEHLADRAIGRQQEDSGGTAPAGEAPAPSAAAVPAAS